MMTELNENHKRALLNAFKHIDHLFCEIETLLDLGNGKACFPRYATDVHPAQRESLETNISEFRKTMCRILESKGISNHQTLMSTQHVIRVTLQFVGIAIQELRPVHMRGYGAPSKKAALELDDIVLKLRPMAKYIETALLQSNDKGRQ